MSIEAMKQVIELYDKHCYNNDYGGIEFNKKHGYKFIEAVEALRTAIQQAGSDHARLPGVLKDHQIAALVNSLRDIARQFHGHGSLRERIANVLVPALKAEAKTGETVAWISKTGHGTYFRQSITQELASLEHGGCKMWRPLVYGDTHPAPGAPDGYVLVPISDLEDAEESIDDYRNGLEFGVSDTSILDRLGALITAAQAQKCQQ